MNAANRSQSLRRRSCPFAQQSWIALLCLGSCSLQDFDRLSRGPSGAGGRVTQAGSGGTVDGSPTNSGNGGDSASTDTAAGQAGDTKWGSAGDGTGTSGYGGSAGTSSSADISGGAGISVGGVNSTNAGQPGVSGSLGRGGGTGDTSACASGAAGCPNPTCSAAFMDCNNSMAADGCETFIYGLTTCGTNCTNLVACRPDQVCNDGVCGAPQGLVKISVPLTEASQGQRYGYKFLPGTDLKNATIIFRVYAPGALAGLLNVYPTDVNRGFGNGVNVPFASMANGWFDVRVPMGNVSGAYNPADMFQLTLEIRADGSGPLANPTVIYVDGLWSTNGLIREVFADSIGPIVTSTLLLVDGSVISWVDTLQASP